jgi:aspartate/methionine/tyrosine aminotransferase
MHWAKTRQAAPYNLAVSGVPAVTLAELGPLPADLELSGPSFYGWPPLQAALARHTGVPEDHIVPAIGTSLANHLAMAACLQPGDEVLLESPTYGLLADTARYLRAVVRRFPRPRAHGFQPDLSALEAALSPRTRLIVLTNLHNPTSARLPTDSLRAISELARRAGARVLVDEVYLEATFDPDVVSAHRLDEAILVTSSLTKVYGLSGLRCGWVLASPELAERMHRLNDLFGVIPAHPAERLGLLALERLPILRERARRILDDNRRLWNAFLADRSDLESTPSTAGTVEFPRLRAGPDAVEKLCIRLRERHETTVAPGRFFGCPDAFRIGLGAPASVFAEGLRRLGTALDETFHSLRHP